MSSFFLFSSILADFRNKWNPFFPFFEKKLLAEIEWFPFCFKNRFDVGVAIFVNLWLLDHGRQMQYPHFSQFVIGIGDGTNHRGDVTTSHLDLVDVLVGF